MYQDITELFCRIDDFCKDVEKSEKAKTLGSAKNPTRIPSISKSEIVTILVMFQTSGMKNFKDFYYRVMPYYSREFQKRPSYNRFLELIPRVFIYFSYLVAAIIMQNQKDGVFFVDSTSLSVCHNKRILRHKVFKGIAERGKTSMGWFFGMKLHLIIDRKGAIHGFKITPGNVHDTKAVDKMTTHLNGLLFGDRGYLSKPLFDNLFKRGLKIITTIRSNMKNKLLTISEKFLLRKRFLIETVFDLLKNKLTLWHTRHRSVQNAFVHLLSCLVSYSIKPNKPKASIPVLIPS